MAIAASSGARLAYVPEATFGTTPATPTFKTLRATGGGLRTNKATITSDEIRADRNVPDEAMVGQDVAGSYPFELSYGSHDDLLEAVMQGAWATNVLKNGVTPKSFTFEETLELGVTDAFSRYSGCMINTLSLSMRAREKITGSIGVMGQKEVTSATIVTGATYAAATSEPILAASGSVAGLVVVGLNPVPKIRSLAFEINNNLRSRPVVGSQFSEEFGAGRIDVTGTIEAYFESLALYDLVLAHGGGALSFTIGQAANKKYTFLFPKIIFLNGERPIGGNSDDVMVSIPFRAVYDATEACSLKITRAVA